MELGALRAWRRALVGEPDVEESPAAPAEAPVPSDDISEAAGKRLMLAIYMGIIAGVLQILALCTRGHWSKTDYDLADFETFWVPAVIDLCGNQPVCRVPSGGEEPASPRHRAGVASMAWRSTRRNAP